MTYLGQINKDTKISPDVFVPHIHRGGVPNYKLFLRFKTWKPPKIYIKFSLYMVTVILCYIFQ